MEKLVCCFVVVLWDESLLRARSAPILYFLDMLSAYICRLPLLHFTIILSCSASRGVAESSWMTFASVPALPLCGKHFTVVMTVPKYAHLDSCLTECTRLARLEIIHHAIEKWVERLGYSCGKSSC